MAEPCPTCGEDLHRHAPKRTTRRLSCAGDCGAWWFQTGPGRNRRFCPPCYAKHRRQLKRGLAVPIHEADEYATGAA